MNGRGSGRAVEGQWQGQGVTQGQGQDSWCMNPLSQVSCKGCAVRFALPRTSMLVCSQIRSNRCTKNFQALVRPISVLRWFLLRLLDSNFLGNSLWAWEFHPLEFKILLESNLLKSRILVRRLAVNASGAGHPQSPTIRLSRQTSRAEGLTS